MNPLKVLASACIGTLVYVLVSLLAGQGGVWAMSQLQNQKTTLSNNVEEIKKINDNLLSEYDGLKNNTEVIAGYAKKLGFIVEGERLIKITGLGRNYNHVYETGSIIRTSSITCISEWICKMIGIIVFGLSIILFLFQSILSPEKKNSHIDEQCLGEHNISSYETIKI